MPTEEMQVTSFSVGKESLKKEANCCTLFSFSLPLIQALFLFTWPRTRRVLLPREMDTKIRAITHGVKWTGF